VRRGLFQHHRHGDRAASADAAQFQVRQPDPAAQVRLSEFLKRIGADTRAKYVWFRCAEGYSNTIDMPTALHPQTQLTFKFDNQILPRKYGFPIKCRIPTKLGFKNPKYITAIYVQNNDAGGYWENQGYNWFSGL